MIMPLLIGLLLTLSEPIPIPLDTLQVGGLPAVLADSIRLERPPPTPERMRAALGEGYAGWKVTGISVRGVPGDVAGELRRGLHLSGQSRWLILRKRPPFSSERLAKDLDRSRLFLVRRGYPAASVEPVFEPRVEKRSLRIAFEVASGPRQLVAANRTEAVPTSLEEKARKLLDLDRDEPFRDSRVEERISRLLRLLQDDGHAKARVTTQLTPVDSTHVEVLFLVDAGEVYHFGEQRITGAPENLMTTVRRTMDIRRGERYSPAKLARADEGLRALDLFRKVELTTVDAGAGILDPVADLAERVPRTIEVGVGYFSDEQLKASSQWKHRNLFGGGRGAAIGASYSRFLQQGALTFWKPILFHSRTRGSLGFRARRESEELYTQRTIDLEAGADYLKSTRTSYRGSITLSRIWVASALPIDSVFDSPPRSLIAAGLRWTHSALDDAIDPSRGTYAWARAEYGLPDLEFAHQYALAEGEGIAYRPVTQRTLLAGRAHFGVAVPITSSIALLPNKRFYGGGANSMRGYRRRKLGPLDEAFRPIGGVALFESSLEYRFPLLGELYGAAFVDAGQVWERRNEFFQHLAVATGPGLILRTPIGLARVDVGFLLTDPARNQPRTVLQVQVGHGF